MKCYHPLIQSLLSKTYLALLFVSIAISSAGQIQPLGPMTSGVYMNCLDLIVDEAEGFGVGNSPNYDWFNRYLNVFDSAEVYYMPDYDLVNLFDPKVPMTANRKNHRLNIAENWYNSFEANLSQYSNYGAQGLQISMVIYHEKNFPIEKTNDFFIDLNGPAIPVPVTFPGEITQLIDQFSLAYDCAGTREEPDLTLRTDTILEAIDMTLEEINEALNPGDSATDSEYLIAEYGKSAARILFSNYREQENGPRLTNATALHAMALKVDAILIEHEYWNSNGAVDTDPSWAEHAKILRLVRNLICRGNRPMLLEDYVKLGVSQGPHNLMPNKGVQADYINRMVDAINVVAMGQNTYAALDRSCKDMQRYSQSGRIALIRPLSNMWSNGAYNLPSDTASIDWTCDRLDTNGTHFGNDPGFYHDIIRNNGDWQYFEEEFKNIFITSQLLNNPILGNCPGFTAPNVILLGYVWNEAAELLCNPFQKDYLFAPTSNSRINLISYGNNIRFETIENQILQGDVILFNSLGQIVKSYNSVMSSEVLSLGTNFSPGIYIVKWSSPEASHATKIILE